MAKIVDSGANAFLKILFGSQSLDPFLYIGLYTNGVEPGNDAVLFDISELNKPNYGRQALKRGDWIISGREAVFAERVFLAGSSAWGYVTGYFIANTPSMQGTLIYVEHFPEMLYIEPTKGIRIKPRIAIL